MVVTSAAAPRRLPLPILVFCVETRYSGSPSSVLYVASSGSFRERVRVSAPRSDASKKLMAI
ncbi:hypothetical protein DFH11DRAFT_1518244 [Phellopilus nigrolimitatus]|nr:hypothetical protein DFH11DRAFT_1518244 [Phellopilus nigrolimitatus]